MMAKFRVARWRQAVDALRSFCPVQKYEVVVRRCKLPAGDEGDCRKIGPKKMMVRVSKEIPQPYCLEVLVHEWAHALSWDIEHERSVSHSAYWGVAYADCYRAVFNPKE